MTTKHLDVGCGSNPRNPLHQDELYGVDIIEQTLTHCNYTQHNIILEPLPFADNTFDSLSAFDFLEHIPRLHIAQNRSIFPFIDFMSEAHRVLKPGGTFYAVTPCYPRAEIFVDPTHVNFISAQTHTYFVLPKLKAAMYGFRGKFEALQVEKMKFSQGANPKTGLAKWLRAIYYTIHYTKKSHILWKFKAVK